MLVTFGLFQELLKYGTIVAMDHLGGWDDIVTDGQGVSHGGGWQKGVQYQSAACHMSTTSRASWFSGKAL